jgi:hypothetical protein
MSLIWDRMSTRVSWKCKKSERLSVIHSSSSSGCSSCSASLSGSTAISCSAAISGMSMGSGSGAGSGSGCSCGAGSGHVGQTLAPLDGAKVWALSDRSVCWCASDPYLSQNVCDKKRERQSPRLRVLSSSMVHSFTEFLDLMPDNLRNGTPESSVE